MSGLLRSLLLKSAKIQKKIDDLQRIGTTDWISVVRLKQIRLRLSERIYQIAGDMFLPSSRFALVPVPVRATRRHFRSVNRI